MDNLSSENLKCDKSVFESVPSHRFIEGIRIYDEWINHKDYPEPPNEKEQPTAASKAMYDRYRSELLKFSQQRIEEWKIIESELN